MRKVSLPKKVRSNVLRHRLRVDGDELLSIFLRRTNARKKDLGVMLISE